MTEPMLFGLTALQVYLFTQWVLGGRLTVPRAAGWVTVLACLTRYEAWPITAAALAASAWAWWRRGNAVSGVLRVHARLALYPALTVLAFLAFSRITVGEWFVSGGFFVPDDTLRGQPAVVAERILEGIEVLGGGRLVRVAAVSLAVVALLGLASAGRAPMLVPLALFAAAALPLSAYLAGHPFRIRYEIPLVVASAMTAGLAVGLLRRWGPLVALLVFVAVIDERPPGDLGAAMVVEAQLDRQVQPRRQVTACLVVGLSRRRRSWRAWARSATTCTSWPRPASRSATSCTRATARSGTAPSRADRRRWSNGCWSRTRPKAATPSSSASGSTRACWSASTGCAAAAACRWYRRRAPGLEANAERRQVVEPAEVDLRARGSRLVEIAFGLLVAHFAAEGGVAADEKPCTEHGDRADRRAGGDVALPENRTADAG